MAWYLGVQWILSSTLHATLSIFYLAAWPVAIFWRVLRFILSPVTYTLHFLISPLIILYYNSPRLAPLYIYFGSAAFIGITFGILLKLTTSGTFAVLGMYDSPYDDWPKSQRRSPAAATTTTTTITKPEEDTRPSTPLTPGSIEQRELEALLASFSSPESDQLGAGSFDLAAALQAAGSLGWRDRPNTKRKRRSASGMELDARRFSTILEEDDDSL